MILTEKTLLDNYTGITGYGEQISQVNGVTIWWEYRTGRDDEGYNCICDRDNATEITFAYDRIGTVDIDQECDNHPALNKIITAESELWGNQVYSI